MSKRAQTSVEYLIILAVVLIVVTIVASILNVASSSSATSAPFSRQMELVGKDIGIEDYLVTDTGTNITLVNNEVSPVQVTAVKVGGTWVASSELPVRLGVHDSNMIYTTSHNYAIGTTYRDLVVINYTIISTSEKRQVSDDSFFIIGVSAGTE